MRIQIYNSDSDLDPVRSVICTGNYIQYKSKKIKNMEYGDFYFLINAFVLCLIKLFNGLFNSVKVLNLTSKMLGTDPDPNFFLRISNTDVLEGNW